MLYILASLGVFWTVVFIIASSVWHYTQKQKAKVPVGHIRLECVERDKVNEFLDLVDAWVRAPKSMLVMNLKAKRAVSLWISDNYPDNVKNSHYWRIYLADHQPIIAFHSKNVEQSGYVVTVEGLKYTVDNKESQELIPTLKNIYINEND